MQAFFLPCDLGQRFCIYHAARNGQARGAIVYLHPFAEEMNKARRMAALQSRALAKAGFNVLQIDLLGCGDSSGDFADATWEAWQDDLVSGCSWLQAHNQGPLILWGLRAGCLLAVSVAARLPKEADFIFWQPAISGKQHWQQFMRLKMAGELAFGQPKGVTEQLRQQLAAGQNVEIAGYTLAPALVDGLLNAELRPPVGHSGRVAWLELSARQDATLAPVSRDRIDQWLEAGFSVNARVVHGPAFWQTTEIEDAPELIEATLRALGSWQ